MTAAVQLEDVECVFGSGAAAVRAEEARTVRYGARDITTIHCKIRNTALILLPQGETLLPFAEAFVRSVDLARGRIVAARPEYAVAD